MKVKTTLTAAGAVFALASTAVAGPIADAGVMPDPVIEPASDDLGFTLSAGYDTDYIFRGVDLGPHLVWSGLDLAHEVAPGVEFQLGAWYADDFNNNGSGNELDLYTGFTYGAGPVDLSVGYIYYYFPGTGGTNAHEVYGSIATEVAGIGIELYGAYDNNNVPGDDGQGWYTALSAGYSVGLTDWLSADFSAGISYNWDYYNPAGQVNSQDWNNVDARLAFPIALTDSATLEPYVAGSWALDALPAQKNAFYGGVSLSVSF